MRPRATTAAQTALEERVAWYAILALPAVVPLVIGLVPFSDPSALTQNPFIYPKIVALALIVAVAGVAWGYGVVRGTIQLRTLPGRWWLIGFLALATLSTLFAMSPAVAFFGGKYQRVGLMVILLAVAAFVLTAQLLTGQRRMRALAWSTVSTGVVAAALVILQSRDLDPLGMSRDNLYVLHRGPSLLGNPDLTATYLVVPVVLAAALALSSPGPRSRLLSWACFGVTTLAVATSLTRGAWVGLLVGVGALVIVAVRSSAARKSAILLVAGLGLAVVLAVAASGPATFAARFSDLSSATTAGDGRLVLWGEAIQVIKTRPLLGTGPDSYWLGWFGARSATSMQLSGMDTVNNDPHNLLLLALATLGIPGGLSAIAVLLAPLVASARTALARDLAPSRLVHTGWWAASLGLLAGLFFGPNEVVLTLMLAMTSAAVLAPRVTVADPVTRIGRPLAVGLALVACIAFVLSAQSLSADMRLARARASGDLSGMDRAVRTAPWHAEAQYLAAYEYSAQAASMLAMGTTGSQEACAAADGRLRALVDDNPHDYAAHVLRAHALAQWGAIDSGRSFEGARVAAADALAVYPLSPVAAFYKALAEVNLGERDAAARTLETLWDIDPDYADAGTLYAEVLIEQGDREEASRVLQVLEERFPRSTVVQNLAVTLETDRP